VTKGEAEWSRGELSRARQGENKVFGGERVGDVTEGDGSRGRLRGRERAL
jgi:hypothetical protein